MTYEKVTFRQRGKQNTVTFEKPWDVAAMRGDMNWIEVLPDGTELDRHANDQREAWQMPVVLVQNPTSKKGGKRGSK